MDRTVASAPVQNSEFKARYADASLIEWLRAILAKAWLGSQA
jgi:hypothetical protein